MRRAALVLLLPLLAVPARARTWDVNDQGTGDAPTLQAAVDSASTGDLVFAAPGVYEDTLNFRGKAITVRGSGPSVTVIEGRGRGSAVRFESGEGRASVLEEFTITGGSGYSLQVPGSRLGGGVYILNAEPTIRANVIIGNTAIKQFTEGDAGEGGGIYCDGTDGSIHAPLIQGNAIRSNAAGASGGGISIVGSMRPEITGNLIRDNEARNGDGGGIRLFVSVPGTTLRDNRLEANTASDRGGGIAVSPDNMAPGALTVDISGNIVVRNRASGFGESGMVVSGGGLWLDMTAAEVRRNTISGNYGYGLASNWGGGVAVSGAGSPLIERNIIAFSAEGGGLACEAPATPVVRDNLSWLHTGGNGSGACFNWVGTAGNVNANPLFCSVATGDYAPEPGSPALTHAAGPVGAIDTGGCAGSPVEATTWGLLKARYGR